VRCYCIGQKDILIMPYEPRNPHHLRYASELKATGEEREKLLETIKDYVLKLNIALGYDFNTVEFAVRDGIPIAIDFCNPAPDADIYSVGHENFEWVVEAAANMAIERAKKHVPGQTNLTWGTFVQHSASLPAMQNEKEEPVITETTSPPVTAEEVIAKVAVKKAAATRKSSATKEPLAVVAPASAKKSAKKKE